MIQARVITITERATRVSLNRAVKLIDPNATLRVNTNMTVRIDTSLDSEMNLAIERRALPIPAGVGVNVRT